MNDQDFVELTGRLDQLNRTILAASLLLLLYLLIRSK